MSGLSGPAADLDELDMDSPEHRWLATRRYLTKTFSDPHEAALNRIWIKAALFDNVEHNAIKRGVLPDERFGDVSVTNLDWVVGYEVTLAPYKGKARDAAAAILKPLMPVGLV